MTGKFAFCPYPGSLSGSAHRVNGDGDGDAAASELRAESVCDLTGRYCREVLRGRRSFLLAPAAQGKNPPKRHDGPAAVMPEVALPRRLGTSYLGIKFNPRPFRDREDAR